MKPVETMGLINDLQPGRPIAHVLTPARLAETLPSAPWSQNEGGGGALGLL